MERVSAIKGKAGYLDICEEFSPDDWRKNLISSYKIEKDGTLKLRLIRSNETPTYKFITPVEVVRLHSW